MGKITVVINEKLLKEAIEAVGAKTKREAIEAGLKELVRKKYLEALRRELGSYDLSLTLEELEKLRSAE